VPIRIPKNITSNIFVSDFFVAGTESLLNLQGESFILTHHFRDFNPSRQLHCFWTQDIMTASQNMWRKRLSHLKADWKHRKGKQEGLKARHSPLGQTLYTYFLQVGLTS
jgi:hypothetical protein